MVQIETASGHVVIYPESDIDPDTRYQESDVPG